MAAPLPTELAEAYRAARTTAVCIPHPAHQIVIVKGRERADFLNRLLTNDTLHLKPSSGCCACYLTAKSTVLADMNVYVEENQILLELATSCVGKTLEAFRALIFSEDVIFDDKARSHAIISLIGPQSAACLRSAFGNFELPQALYQHQRVGGTPDDPILIRQNVYADPEWRLVLAKEMEERFFSQCPETCRVPANSEALAEILRIERGVPKYGVDFDESTLFSEMNLDHAVSETKGCYPGQEVVARFKAYGRIPRSVVRLALDGTCVPRKGDSIFSEGKQAGRITSGCFSVALNRPIALGILEKSAVSQNAELQVKTSAGPVSSRIVSIPAFQDIAGS
jgi:folate-binding protein YgfZ